MSETFENAYVDASNAFSSLLANIGKAERLQQQAEQWHQTTDFIAGAGNHEAKIVTGLVLFDMPERDFTRTALHREIVSRQGPNPGWVPSLAVPFFYCQRSLEPLGQVVKTSINSQKAPYQPTEAYRFNDEALPERIAALGLLGEWSLRWADVSVQRLLGATQSNGGTRSPEARANLFLELLTDPRGFVAESEIEGLSETHPHTQKETDAELAKLGIVLQENVVANNDRLLAVTRTTYENHWPLESLRIETQLVYEFLASKQVGYTFTKQELLEYLLKRTSEIDSTTDPAEVRKYLMGRIPNRSTGEIRDFAGIKRAGPYNDGSRTGTRIKLNPDYLAAVEDLMEIFVSIQDGDDKRLSRGLDAASSIIRNPASVRRLMHKAQYFSNKARSIGSEAVRGMIMGIIRDEEAPIIGDGIHQKLKEKGLTVASATVRLHLSDMVKQGMLSSHQTRRTTDTRTAVLAYTMPSADETK